MKTSVIRHRVADFLKSHAPFDALTQEDLLDLAGSGRVKFHQAQEYVCRQGDGKGQFVWVIQQGRVELLREGSSGDELRDVLGEGDVLGLERFMGDGSARYSARTGTDVILYGVSASLVEGLMPRYPAMKRFVAAHVSMSGTLGSGRTSWLDGEAPSLAFLRSRLVTTTEGASREDMVNAVLSSPPGVAAIVNSEDCIRGTVTARDLLQAGGGPAIPEGSVAAIGAPLTTRSVVRKMLENGTEVLAVTADGTSASRLDALVTGQDAALFCGYDIAALVRSLRNAANIDALSALAGAAKSILASALAQPGDVADCSNLASHISSAFAGACIRLAQGQGRGRSEAIRGTWLTFGTASRSESLLPEPPFVALVYDQPAGSAELAAEASRWAADVYGLFAACGFPAPAGWPEGVREAMPLAEWEQIYVDAISNPLGSGIYEKRELFDLGMVCGEKSVVEHLSRAVLTELQEGNIAIPLLANDTLGALPPLTFFRGLVLDLEGKQQDSFDVRSAAILPIVDAARVFALAKRRLSPANTLERLAAAEADYPDAATIFQDAAEAFRIALYYQALAPSSRIEPSTLGKLDQRLFKTAFTSIQRLIEYTAYTFAFTR